ncbi:hypothetical protein K502DRAFT_328114 [Neoconidiobolus thromboides FSU 785]|nr:hypothetical protein K502DRAFT_328114 [Neoconidiobolus thromboides FSU 785]
MALNWVTLGDDNKTFVPLDNESHFLCQSGVSVEFSSGNQTFSSPKGLLYLTNIRVVYIAFPSTPLFQSLSIPLENLKNTEFIQPWFGANYFKGLLLPVLNGNLREEGELKFHFNEGGGFSFIALLKQVNQRRQELNDNPEHLESLPLYRPASPESNQNLESEEVSGTQTTSENPPPIGDDLPPSYESIAN